jgi:nitrogen fixation-related uncharacterized protein
MPSFAWRGVGEEMDISLVVAIAIGVVGIGALFWALRAV